MITIESIDFTNSQKKKKNNSFQEKEKKIKLVENVSHFDVRLENERGIRFKDQPDVHL